MKTKICSRCGEAKEENRFPTKNGKCISWCKDCANEYQKQYRADNKDKLIEQRKKNYASNKERKKKSAKEYYNKNSNRLRESARKYHHEHKEQRQAYSKKRNRDLKREVMDRYGKVCVCCGESTIEFLSIDHINGGGKEERKRLGMIGGVNFYSYLKKNNFPSGYRVLCFNCNLSYGFFGYCPHNKE